MEKLYKIKELKHKLIDDLCRDIEKCGIDEYDVHLAGEQVDMIKDLAEAEEKCVKAHYYATVIEAMEEGSERPGYDRWRYSSGQYAPKGHGHMTSGYPSQHVPVYMDHMMPEHRMGYPSSQTGKSHTYGYSGTESHHDHENADGYITETVETMRDIWKDAPLEQKKMIKSNLSALLAEMAM